jgi:RNA polymerase sigma-70 factor (sigma-E family)
VVDPENEKFEDFVPAALPRLLRTAELLTGNPHDAWDLVQETLLRVGSRWRRVLGGPRANPYGYCHRTMLNLHASTWRKRQREVFAANDSSPDPRDGYRQVDLRADVVDLLRGLSPRHRQILVLRYLHDLPLREIAELTHTPLGTVKSVISRSLAQLRKSPADSRTQSER